MPASRAVPLCLLSVILWAAEPPAIRKQGIVNAASQRPAAVGGAIARGSVISIHGVRFSPAMEGNRVTIESRGHTRTLPVLRAGPQRIDAWVLPDAPLGEARLTVTANGLASAPETIAILKSAPGLYSANGQGWGPAQSGNTPANSAPPGGRVTLVATGLSIDDKPTLLVGNVPARVSLEQPTNHDVLIEVRIPPQAPEGCYVPVYARVPGAPPSNTVTIAIHRGGGPCVPAAGDPAAGWNGGKTAILLLSRTVARPLDPPHERLEDEVNAGFFDVPAGKARASPLLLLPPPGACTTWSGALKADTLMGMSIWTMLFGSIPGTGLDAGPWIAVRTSSLQLRAPYVTGAPGLYRRTLSSPAGRMPSRFRMSLEAGRFALAGPGGPQVGPFATALPAPVPFTMSSQPPERIARAQPVAVEWNADRPAGTMILVLVGADPNLNVASLAYCTAPQSAGRLSVPADLLSQLPAGSGQLVLATWSRQSVAQPPTGIAHMFALSGYARSWEVRLE